MPCLLPLGTGLRGVRQELALSLHSRVTAAAVEGLCKGQASVPGEALRPGGSAVCLVQGRVKTETSQMTQDGRAEKEKRQMQTLHVFLCSVKEPCPVSLPLSPVR